MFQVSRRAEVRSCCSISALRSQSRLLTSMGDLEYFRIPLSRTKNLCTGEKKSTVSIKAKSRTDIQLLKFDHFCNSSYQNTIFFRCLNVENSTEASKHGDETRTSSKSHYRAGSWIYSSPYASLLVAISASSAWTLRVCPASGRDSDQFSAPRLFPSCPTPRRERKSSSESETEIQSLLRFWDRSCCHTCRNVVAFMREAAKTHVVFILIPLLHTHTQRLHCWS